VKDDRRFTRIRVTDEGTRLFRKTFAAHTAFLRPFVERALNRQSAAARDLLLRLRESVHHVEKAIHGQALAETGRAD
jgi:MarR family 2-MHQ and catechol resistance regulon transcriptional repressor